MSLNAVRRLAVEGLTLKRVVNVRSLFYTQRLFSDGLKGSGKSFDVSLLQFLVCPLSKKPLRYDETANELINEELGIAYPIINGIPNMIPQDARLIKKAEGTEEPTQA